MSQDDSRPAPRVALVTGGLPLGGSTTFLCNLGGELVRRKVPVEVLSFDSRNPLAADFQRRNLPVLGLDAGEIFEDRMEKIMQRLAVLKPTVVLANLSAVSFEVFRYLPPGIFRIGVIHSDEDGVYEMAEHYAGCVDLIAVVSKIIRERLQRKDAFANVTVSYLPLGVPMPAEETAVRPDPRRPLRILYIGRLACEQKRVRLFPEILRQLQASGIPFHWTIAGAGPERDFLETNMQSAQPDQTVSFAGSVDYAGVPALLKQHDIFLLASDYEGLPLSLLEAMGHGLVPVVSDLPSGIPEVVNAANGLLVPVADVAGYARAIVHLHRHRDELAAKSIAARECVKTEFSVAAMTDRWLAVFPKTSPPVEWPARWDIQAPLPARHPVYFSTPVRFFRRLAAKLRR